jgi:hypothetical protein
MSSSISVEVSGLTMSYGTTKVLHGVDFTIARGEVLVLLGPNGAGKTTTIEILEGFRLPSAGTVRVLGEDPAKADELWRSRIGVVLQSWRDHGRWRVRDLLDHLAAFYLPYATRAGGPPRPSASSDGPSCSSWTNRRPASIPPPAATSTTWCTGCPICRTPRSCSPLMTWTRRRSWPIGS